MSRREFVSQSSPRVLLVSSDAAVCGAISGWLRSAAVAMEAAGSYRAALDLLHDLLAAELPLDGLLVDAELSDGYAFRVIRDYRHEFSALPIALITAAENDISLGVWSKSKQIPILRKPADRSSILEWLEQTVRNVERVT